MHSSTWAVALPLAASLWHWTAHTMYSHAYTHVHTHYMHAQFDMGGGAATLGTAMAVGLLKPADVEAHFIVAACENMVSAEAMRPGDILTASNGKTIEV